MEDGEIKKNLKSNTSKLGRHITVGIFVVFLGGLVLISVGHVIQMRHLKQAASSIHIGDSRAKVVRLLGKPRVTYTSGFPSGGGAAAIWGSCYGGSLDLLREVIDGCVYRICNGRPRWYHGFQNKEDWPVIIEFDKDGIVTAVNP